MRVEGFSGQASSRGVENQLQVRSLLYVLETSMNGKQCLQATDLPVL